jgi:hypothetical protein
MYKILRSSPVLSAQKLIASLSNVFSSYKLFTVRNLYVVRDISGGDEGFNT